MKTSNADTACGCESVCSLPPRELEKRRALVRRSIAPHLRAVDCSPDRVVWHLDRSARVERQLRAFVELERQCCSSLELTIEKDEELRLTIAGSGAELFAGALDCA